jgi:hypothetical protein
VLTCRPAKSAQRTNPADDTRQHAPPWRSFAGRVLPSVSPRDDHQRRSVARSNVRARVRAAHGLHEVWGRWCRRPPELAGATGAAERRWHCAMAMSAERHRVLEISRWQLTRLHRSDVRTRREEPIRALER